MSEESRQLSAALMFNRSDERGKLPRIINSEAMTWRKPVPWRDILTMPRSPRELTLWEKPAQTGGTLPLIVAALALAHVMATPAQADGDTQLWNTQNFNYKINDKWSTNLEIQERWYGDVSYFAFFIVRPSVTYKWNDWLSFTGGYAHFRVYDGEGDFADEDRIWEQVNIRLFGGEDQPILNWRTRLEQRMFEAGGDTVWRLREQLRLMYPIVDGVQGVIWTEAFWRLNDVVQANGRSLDGGIEQWRNFAGLNFEITKNFTFEAGYMNVYTWRASGNTDDHVPWLISTFKF